MKFSSVFCTAVLATSALASPLQARQQNGTETNRSTHPPTNKHSKGNGHQNEQYSSNWAGAVLIGNGYTAVSGQFVVPVPKMPSGGNPNTQYCASAWVGIDGDTCQRAILQTGVDFCTQNGKPSYSAWYEWFPDFAYNFKGIPIAAGDLMSVSVVAHSLTTGTATVENLTQKKTVTHNFGLVGAQSPLCEQNAEWIVEDFLENGQQAPFANFGNVTFTNAQATQNGATVGPAGATIIDIKQNGKVLTHSSVTANSVNIDYIG